MTDLLLTLLSRTSPPPLVRYAMTVLLVAVVAVLGFALDPIVEDVPFLLFLPVIVACALLYERLSGLLAVGLSLLAGVGLWSVEHNIAWILHSPPLLTLVLFLLIGLGLATVTETLRTALDRVRQADTAKTVLLQEIYHRMRNDLRGISLLIHAANQQLAEPNPLLDAILARTEVLTKVYSRLEWHGERAVVNVRDFLTALIDDLYVASVGLRPIAIQVTADDVTVPVNTAVEMGIAVNEFVTNALKYAFPDNRAGAVTVTFRREDDHDELVVQDDGVGRRTNAGADGGGIGHAIVEQIARQLGGTLITDASETGFRATLRVPSPRS